MSEREEDTEDEEFAGPGAGASAGTSRRNDRSASLGRREQSASPRSDRRSVASAGPPRPSKVTLVKSRKNEGESGPEAVAACSTTAALSQAQQRQLSEKCF